MAIPTREVKFRVWDTRRKRMLRWDGGGPDAPVITLDHQIAVVAVPEARHLVDPVLMQFTGLRDKNGREIYDGDICRVDHLDPRYDVVDTVVTWDAGEAGWSVGVGVPSEVGWSHEVVGNVYENPELLAEGAAPAQVGRIAVPSNQTPAEETT